MLLLKLLIFKVLQSPSKYSFFQKINYSKSTTTVTKKQFFFFFRWTAASWGIPSSTGSAVNICKQSSPQQLGNGSAEAEVVTRSAKEKTLLVGKSDCFKNKLQMISKWYTYSMFFFPKKQFERKKKILVRRSTKLLVSSVLLCFLFKKSISSKVDHYFSQKHHIFAFFTFPSAPLSPERLQYASPVAHFSSRTSTKDTEITPTITTMPKPTLGKSSVFQTSCEAKCLPGEGQVLRWLCEGPWFWQNIVFNGGFLKKKNIYIYIF